MTLRASVALTGRSARERGDAKRLEQHDHVRARPAAVMATRWSHAHGESYLRQKWSGGGVEDVERLTVVLWFRGIRQWRSVLGGIGSAVLRRSGRRACGGRRGKAKMERRHGGQAQGLQDAAVRARASTARGQREQESGDEWRTRGVCFLNRSATAVLKVF